MENFSQKNEIKKYRAIWISDIHLGTSGCKAEYLNDFLKNIETEYLYLVGDIIDCWRLKTKFYWPSEHNKFIQKILKKAKKGTKIIYIPGNHDEVFRNYVGLNFGGILLEEEVIHETKKGLKFLVIHGDKFDVVTRYHKWLAYFGDHSYTFLLWINTYFNRYIRKKIFKLPYWSLSKFIKLKAKQAVSFISSYEESIASEAKKRNVDGVICGHIHHPEIKIMNGILYCNDGDWVESCSALVEHLDGELELIYHIHEEKN